MKLQIYVFAGIAEHIQGPVIHLEWKQQAPLTPVLLKQHLMERYPQAAALWPQAFIAINQSYAEDNQIIVEGDEIAIIPPVSGGQVQLVEITQQPISIEAVTAKVLHPNHGATLTFIGTTREWTHGKRTTRLEYEAYEPMAVKTMLTIVEQISASFEGTLCAITHRLGVVAVGECSVVIAVSAPHRDAAYEASRYAIERLKQMVPIWKKEIWEDGSEWKGHQQGPWNPLANPMPERS
ncbi:molybdenum cofactor biosynthesis protein [Paenibacillus agricola]|uniref:Molybdopterin converting factor n=1 Tax=Paenibacillus agricola TaxID=2716264 RepID=A0ABX0J9Q0_9BACL|nr:molybdenum cofactor biosynthesis protein MoaE [Paenibacillus agricola]NHN31602.1 molybdopterin converting factor [Paenibacillus agricola]